MIDIVAGAILGTITSAVIAHLYYHRSTRDLERQVDELRKDITSLESMSRELQRAADAIAANSEVTKRHVVAGTPDDPEYPYK